MLYYFSTPHIHKLEWFIMVYLSRVDISIAFNLW